MNNIFAILKDNVVINTAIATLENSTLLQGEGLLVVNIPSLSPMPSKGWTYDQESERFLPPSPGEGFYYDELSNMWIMPEPEVTE